MQRQESELYYPIKPLRYEVWDGCVTSAFHMLRTRSSAPAGVVFLSASFLLGFKCCCCPHWHTDVLSPLLCFLDVPSDAEHAFKFKIILFIKINISIVRLIC